VNRLSQALASILEWFLMFLMVALTVIVVVAVIYRKLDASLSWYDEVASVGLAWITYYGGALAVLKRKHIGFDSVLLAIPMPVRLYLAIFAEIVFIAFFALLAWAGWQVVLILEGDSLVSLRWVSVQLTQSVIPIGAALFIICELLAMPEYFRMVINGESAEHADIEAEIAAEMAAAGNASANASPDMGGKR